MKLEQAQSQCFECHVGGACQPFLLNISIPTTFFHEGRGAWGPQCYHSLILFESGRVWAGKGAKRASWVVRGGNTVISEGRWLKITGVYKHRAGSHSLSNSSWLWLRQGVPGQPRSTLLTLVFSRFLSVLSQMCLNYNHNDETLRNLTQTWCMPLARKQIKSHILSWKVSLTLSVVTLAHVTYCANPMFKEWKYLKYSTL